MFQDVEKKEYVETLPAAFKSFEVSTDWEHVLYVKLF